MSIDCEESENGCYIAYSNMLCDEVGDGSSSLFGLMDNIFLEKLKSSNFTDLNPPWKICELTSSQSYIILELNLEAKKPYAKRTIHTKPNIRLIEIGGKDDSNSTEFVRKIAHNDERYTKIDSLFVPPREYETLLNKIEESKLLFIVGDPGIGKTYTAVKILKHYFQLDYAPIWYAGLEKSERIGQRQILENFKPTHKQIIYFEDPFGRTSFEKRESIQRIFGPLLDYLQDVDALVVITSRREIFEQFTKEVVTSVDLNHFSEDMNVVKPSYSPSALCAILKKLAINSKWYKIDECKKAVLVKVESGHLSTPLAIRDFVFSAENVSDKETLFDRLERRGIEEKCLFSEDIQASNIKTKLALSLIFFFGSQSLTTLSEWYNQIIAFLDPKQDFKGTAPFIHEIRYQLGYRLEQFGDKATVFRFIHPSYEEAFVETAGHDPVTYDTVSSVVKYVSRAKIRTSTSGLINKYTKYPSLIIKLLYEIIPVFKTNENIVDISFVGLKIIGLFDRTINQDLLLIIEKIISPNQIIEKINKENDIQAIEIALRFYYKFCSRFSSLGKEFKEWKNRLIQDVDWESLKRKWATEPNLSKIINCLYWTSVVAVTEVKSFLQDMNKQELKGKVRTLAIYDRTRFFDICNECRLGNDFINFINPGTESPVFLNNHVRQKRLSVRKWMLENPNTKDGIIIDDGAYKALKGRFSLLPIGIISVSGNFSRGDAVSLFDENGRHIGFGITLYNSNEVEKIKGRHSSLIDEILINNFGIMVMRTDYISLN